MQKLLPQLVRMVRGYLPGFVRYRERNPDPRPAGPGRGSGRALRPGRSPSHQPQPQQDVRGEVVIAVHPRHAVERHHHHGRIGALRREHFAYRSVHRHIDIPKQIAGG